MCCSICLESCTDDVMITTCNHTFHKECLQKSVSYGMKTCPICRGNIDTDISKHNFNVSEMSIQNLGDDYDSDVSEQEYVPDSVDWFHFFVRFGFR